MLHHLLRAVLISRCCLGILHYNVFTHWPTAHSSNLLHINNKFTLFHLPPLQSPINLKFSETAIVVLPSLEYHNLMSGDALVKIKNTGSTVEFDLEDRSVKKPYLTGGPLGPYGEFEFDNLHIHWGAKDILGAEHMVNGKRYAIEGHCVHFNRKYGSMNKAKLFPDGLAVVAFFGKAGNADNPKMEHLMNIMSNITYPESSVTMTTRESLGWFADLGKPNNYFTYLGSLTTSPYTENVIWIVYPEPMLISSPQVNRFQNLMSKDFTSLNHNVRPIQDLNGRPLLYTI